MQYLKEEVRNNIISNAVNEFFTKGFSDANMRDIAKNSNMTVGNIYRYFKNKEELFTVVVEPAYKSMIDLIKVENHLKVNYEEHFEYVEPILKQFIEICEKYPREIVIILDRYIGVSNYKLLENLQEVISIRLKQEIPHINDEQCQMVNYLILRGILYILQNYQPEKFSSELRSFFIFLFKDIDRRI